MKIFSIKIGSYRFAPSILVLMAGIFLIAVFAGLGRWQVDRMYEKLAIEDQFDARILEGIRVLPSAIDAPEWWRYREVSVKGKWLSEKQFLLDNQVQDRVAGYNVITPFTHEDGRTILIDRGWVALVEGARDELPDVTIAANNKPSKVEGLFYVPYGKNPYNDSEWIATKTWPLVIPALDFEKIEAKLGTPVEKFVIRMSPTLEDGYLRRWPVVAFSSMKHLGYAVQWFALSLVVLFLLIALNIKRVR